MASKPKKAVSKVEVAVETKTQDNLKKVGQMTIESVAKKVTDTTLSISKTLNDVNSQLQTSLNEFNEVNSAVEAKKEELSKLFGAEEVLKDIDSLQAEFENKRTTVENEFEAFKADLDAKKQTITIERQKEDEQFQFELAQTRREEQEKYNESQRLQAIVDRDRREAIEKDLKFRSDELKKREEEFLSFKKQVEEFPAKLDAEVKKAEAILKNVLTKDSEHKIQLLQKDFDTSKAIAQSNIDQLTKQLAAQDKAIEALQNQVNSAQSKVAEIAKDALASASSTKSLADVQSVLQTQANGSGARKT